MRSKIFMLFLCFGTMLTATVAIAQQQDIAMQEVNEDNLENVTDAFQENFFEALKQKGIENYEKAIRALEVCEKLEPENPVVFFEKGKNYKLLGNYEAAIQNLQKSNRLKPNQEWVLVELMDAFYANQDFEPAIIVAKNLVKIHPKYQTNLADLYLRSQKFDELIVLLDQLDAQLGVTEYRLGLRQQIYALTNNTSAQIQTIKQSIKTNPENENNYLQLIFVYSEQGMEKEAFEAAENMVQKFPNSSVVHLALYKFYLQSNNTRGAVNSMKIVFNAEEIDPEAKFKVLADFLAFVRDNPEYENDLLEVVNLFAETENYPGVYKQIGEYYFLKNDQENALEFFELGIAQDMDNIELLTNTLLLQLELSRYSEAVKLSETALEIFPAQPILYLINGLALNQQKEYKQAKEILTFGLDYVIDNKKMTGDFYEQLSIAYTGIGDVKKAKEFEEKVKEINKTLN